MDKVRLNIKHAQRHWHWKGITYSIRPSAKTHELGLNRPTLKINLRAIQKVMFGNSRWQQKCWISHCSFWCILDVMLTYYASLMTSVLRKMVMTSTSDDAETSITTFVTSQRIRNDLAQKSQLIRRGKSLFVNLFWCKIWLEITMKFRKRLKFSCWQVCFSLWRSFVGAWRKFRRFSCYRQFPII